MLTFIFFGTFWLLKSGTFKKLMHSKSRYDALFSYSSTRSHLINKMMKWADIKWAGWKMGKYKIHIWQNENILFLWLGANGKLLWLLKNRGCLSRFMIEGPTNFVTFWTNLNYGPIVPMFLHTQCCSFIFKCMFTWFISVKITKVLTQ